MFIRPSVSPGALCGLLCVLMALSGCAKKYVEVTYTSDPPGAVLCENGRAWGYTPISLRYDLTPEDRESGSKVIMGSGVQWYSGAVARIGASCIPLKYKKTIHFTRPAGVPGLADDIRVGEELEKERRLRNTREFLKGVLAGAGVALFVHAVAQGAWYGFSPDPVFVQGYTRNDGTYVQPHFRTAPDGSPYNNWSTVGNVNPYTGEEGTVSP